MANVLSRRHLRVRRMRRLTTDPARSTSAKSLTLERRAIRRLKALGTDRAGGSR